MDLSLNTADACHSLCSAMDNFKHHVLLLTGWDESFIKYGEVISDLLAAECCVYTMDWRSQGLSGRHLLDPQVTYVKDFDDYLEDLRFFIDEVVLGACGVHPSSLTCMAHSMGGFIALKAVAEGWGSSRFQRLVTCSPMIKMKVGMPHFVARGLAAMLCRLGWGESYAPGESGVDVAKPITKLLTTDKTRLAIQEKIRGIFPLVAMGGMSNRWVLEAIKAQDWFAKHNGNVDIPVLVLEAGIDTFVCTRRPFSKLCRLAKDCKRIRYPATYHEIFFEKDWARAHAINASIKFLKTGEGPEDQYLEILPPDEVKDWATRRRRLFGFLYTSFHHHAHSFYTVAIAAGVVIIVCAAAVRKRRDR